MAACLLLFALLLVATLIGPSAYLIAWNAGIAAEYGGAAGLVADQIGQRSGDDGETRSAPSPKRPKGVLKSGGEINNILTFAVFTENLAPVEGSGPAPTYTTVRAEPGSIRLVPQLLQRPPPAG